MIKPDDVPNELAMFAGGFSDVSPRQSRDMVAAILNAAIEAGIVVPASEARVLRLAVKMLHVAYGALIALHYPGEKPPTVEFVIGEARKDLGIEGDDGATSTHG